MGCELARRRLSRLKPVVPIGRDWEVGSLLSASVCELLPARPDTGPPLASIMRMTVPANGASLSVSPVLIRVLRPPLYSVALADNPRQWPKRCHPNGDIYFLGDGQAIFAGGIGFCYGDKWTMGQTAIEPRPNLQAHLRSGNRLARQIKDLSRDFPLFDSRCFFVPACSLLNDPQLSP